MKKFDIKSTKMIVTLGLLAAIEIVLSRFFSINAWNIKIGFSFVPLAVAGMLYGAVPAAATALVADLIGATLFPSGQFHPGFTLTTVLVGLTFGLFLYKKQTTVRILMAVAVNQICLSLFLQSYWISSLYLSPYWVTLGSRIPQVLLLAPTQFIVIGIMAKALGRFGKKALA